MAPRNPELYEEARRMRRQFGTPLKRIAKQLGISVATAHAWTKDIALSPEQIERNRSGPRGPQNPAHVAARVERWRERHRERRRGWQEDGRAAARLDDPLHQAGCMLYWAEGAKARNHIKFANSDREMLRFFLRFLRESLGVADSAVTLRLNVYTTNGLTLREIEDHWLWG